jgi:hypothetical protein
MLVKGTKMNFDQVVAQHKKQKYPAGDVAVMMFSGAAGKIPFRAEGYAHVLSSEKGHVCSGIILLAYAHYLQNECGFEETDSSHRLTSEFQKLYERQQDKITSIANAYSLLDVISQMKNSFLGSTYLIFLKISCTTQHRYSRV